MGKKALRGRGNWQQKGGEQAGKAEHRFEDVFQKTFVGTNFTVIPKPKELRNIYSGVELPTGVANEIYTPAGESWTHGVVPDFAIRNSETGKTLYVEVKRQDGWVEGKERKAGRGNAHERSCKFFTPGLLKVLRRASKIPEPDLPFWTVFQGDIARDPKRVREIHLWYVGYEQHFFLWSENKTSTSVVDHFNANLKQLLI
jgi:hypothetical protein